MNPCVQAQAAPVLESHELRPTAQELWKRYHQQGDSPSENALVERYLPLVRSVLGRLAMSLPV